MSQKFSEGQQARHLNGRTYTVESVREDGWLKFEDWDNGFFDPSYYTAVPRWEDVNAGDTVTFRTDQTGEEYTALVTTSPDSPTNPDPHVMGIWTGSTALNGRNTLLSIKKPQPPLPTANGSVIRRKVTNGSPTFHLIGGEWLGSRSGGRHRDPNQWEGGWELIRDADEES